MIIIKLRGGLGNQLFQYAAAYQLSLLYKHDNIYFELSEFKYDKQRNLSLNKLKIEKGIPLPYKIKKSLYYKVSSCLEKKYPDIVKIMGKCFISDELIRSMLARIGFFYCTYDNPNIPKSLGNSKNIFLSNYFQNIKYSSKVIGKLKKQFVPQKKVEKKFDDFLKLIKKQCSICIHIRLGDYQKNSLHEVCNINYYEKAICEINKHVENPVYIIFSDDKNFVREHYQFSGTVLFEPDNLDDVQTLYLMSQCKHYILSNSSLSWWAQKMSDSTNKIVIAPSRWYNDKQRKYDLLQSEWLLIDI